MNKRSQHGYSLPEILVAIAIFTIIVLAALMLYDRQNKVFKAGVESADMQQNTRVAFEKLLTDVRMAGFDFDRDGIPSGAKNGVNFQQQPDEQIEYMGSTAIVFRANLNYATAGSTDNGRETAYENDAFPVVTTANNEIVAYALKSADDTKNTGSIEFYADVAKPRAVYLSGSPLSGPKERKVVIPNVDLTNANPPYTLYRYTLKDIDLADSVADPIGTAVPLASNIRSLNFTYYSDTSGSTEVAAVGGGGQYDPTTSATVADRDTRKSVLSVRINLVGLNEAPDPQYANPTETIAALQNYREFSLSSLIVPRNSGMKGIKEELLHGPDKPIIRSVCVGACGVPYLTWDAPTSGGVDYYTILYDTDPAGAFTQGRPVGNVTSAYLDIGLTPNVKYYFKIQASNGYGQSVSDDMLDGTPIAYTQPSDPASLTATDGATAVANKIVVTWPAVTTNVSSASTLTCKTNGAASATAPGDTIPSAEQLRYRVWRAEGSANANFDPATTGTLLCDESTTTLPYVVSGGTVTLTDQVPNCVDYYYRVQAVVKPCCTDDTLNITGTKTLSTSGIVPAVGTTAELGRAVSSTAAAQPASFTVVRDASCVVPDTTDNLAWGVNFTCSMKLQWNPVTADSAGNPMKVKTYTIKRQVLKPDWEASASLTTLGTVTADWTDASTPLTYTATGQKLTSDYGETRQYKYYVYAENGCSGVASSVAATFTYPAQYYSGTAPTIAAPGSTTGGNGLTPGTPWSSDTGDAVTIVDGARNMVSYKVVITDGGTIVATQDWTAATSGGGAKNGSFAWPSLTDGVTYEIEFLIKDSSGQVYTMTRYLTDGAGGCLYSGGTPTITTSRAQANNGLTAATYWSLVPGDTITLTESKIAKVTLSFTDPVTGVTLAPDVVSTGGSPRAIPWPTLTYGTTYRVDFTVADSLLCETTLTRYVKQICVTYSGGTPTISSTDTSNTGTTVASPWYLQSGNTITVSESSLKTLGVTIINNSTSATVSTNTYTASGGLYTLSWPSLTNGTTYKVNFTLTDSFGCTSSAYTRYVLAYCAYSGGTTPVYAVSDGGGSGTSYASPYYLVFSTDNLNTGGASYLTVTEAQLKKITLTYYPCTSAASCSSTASLTQTVTNPSVGSALRIYPGASISGGNNTVYKVDVILEDVNGCQTKTYPATGSVAPIYIKQRPCCMNTGISQSYSSASKQATFIFQNNCGQDLTLNSVKLTWTSNNGNKMNSIAFPGGTASSSPLGSNNSPMNVTVPGTTAQRTVAAGGTFTIVVTFSKSDTTNPVSDICVSYDTTVGTIKTNSCNTIVTGANNPGTCN